MRYDVRRRRGLSEALRSFLIALHFSSLVDFVFFLMPDYGSKARAKILLCEIPTFSGKKEAPENRISIEPLARTPSFFDINYKVIFENRAATFAPRPSSSLICIL